MFTPLSLAALLLGPIAVYGLLSWYIAHRFTSARRTIAPSRLTASRPQPRHVRFVSRVDGLRLTGTHYDTPGATAGVVLVHGRDASSHDVLRDGTHALAESLCDAGFHVVLVDLRGHGESQWARLTFGQHERRDVLGAVDFLTSHGVPAHRIGLLGASMGGVSAIGAAAEHHEIGALVVDSAFSHFDAILQRQFARLTKLPPMFLLGAELIARRLTGVRLRLHAPVDDIRGVRCPTLVIHAEGDQFIPVSNARTLAEAASAALWVTSGSHHLGSYGVDAGAYTDRVCEFFRVHLLDGGAPPYEPLQYESRSEYHLAHGVR